jgi:hypothetical protein
MWESKEQAIDVNYNSDELWFVGAYGQPVAKRNEQNQKVGRKHKALQAFGQDLPSFES